MQKSAAQSSEIINSLHLIRTKSDEGTLLRELAAPQLNPRIVSWLNAHTLTYAYTNAELTSCLQRSSMVLRDGVGISILLRIIGRDPGLNVNGTDYIPKILESFKGKRVALLGTSEPYLSEAMKAIEAMGCQVVLYMDGFQTSESYLSRLRRFPADLVILGMGVPKQECLSVYLADNLSYPTLILNGGAILDFISSRFPRAPQIWRDLRLEWLFRLLKEPRRLWRRYIIGGALFLFYTLQIIYVMKYSPAEAQ